MIAAIKRTGPFDEPASRDALPHILLVLDQLPKTLGGGERIALKLAALLPSYGYHASILTFFIHPESSVINSPPCPIYELPLRRTYGFTAIRAAIAFRRFLRRQSIQIVQTFFESSDLWAGFVTKTAPRSKLIWSRRDMGILRSRKHHIGYRLLAGAPDAVFAVSEQVRRHCIDVDRIDPSRVLTIHNGLDLSGWNAASRPAHSAAKVVIATVGNIRAVKGHDDMVRAAALTVPHLPNISFRVAGDILEDAYFVKLQALVQDLNLEDHFTFTGGVTDLRSYLAEADIFVLPSRSEGFSNAIVEAMAASLPVVATDVGGNYEAVQDGVSGLLVPSEDPAALSSAIMQLLSDPAKATRMGAAGREIVENRFTTEAMMSQIASVYEALLSDKSL
jgi:glycosyltransferase involved in cell wall biosynthesis